MSGQTDESGWFAEVDPSNLNGARAAIEHGSADDPADWPQAAVDAGFASDTTAYYDLLHEAAVTTTRELVEAAEAAADQQLSHSVRAMDDCQRIANELAERVSEWASSYLEDDGAGMEFVRAVADREPSDAIDARITALANEATALADQADALRVHVEQMAPTVAPNLSALAGPVLAARLIALASGLEELAKKPSGTVQVLGAEDALFAHLQGRAPSPKHGVIYIHEYVQGTPPEHRGSAARALAGKLVIAARVDYYSGERRPELDEELTERIQQIRARGQE